MATVRAQERGPSQTGSVIVVPHACDSALVTEVARILPIELGAARPEAAMRPSLRIMLSCTADAVELRSAAAERGSGATSTPSDLGAAEASRRADANSPPNSPHASAATTALDRSTPRNGPRTPAAAVRLDPTTTPDGLRARDAATHLDLSTTPNDLRPRVIALHIAELVRNLTAPPRPSAAAAPPAPRAPPGRRAQLSLAGLARLTTFRGDGKWHGGGGLNLTLQLAALALGLELGAATRRDSSPLGQVRVWSGQLAPQASFGFSFAATTLRSGAGYAFGFARMRGKARALSAGSKTLCGYWSAPFVLLALEQALHERIRLHVSGIVGWVRPAVVGEVAQGRDIAIAGIWSELRLGAAYRF